MWHVSANQSIRSSATQKTALSSKAIHPPNHVFHSSKSGATPGSAAVSLGCFPAPAPITNRPRDPIQGSPKDPGRGGAGHYFYATQAFHAPQ